MRVESFRRCLVIGVLAVVAGGGLGLAAHAVASPQETEWGAGHTRPAAVSTTVPGDRTESVTYFETEWA